MLIVIQTEKCPVRVKVVRKMNGPFFQNLQKNLENLRENYFYFYSAQGKPQGRTQQQPQ